MSGGKERAVARELKAALKRERFYHGTPLPQITRQMNRAAGRSLKKLEAAIAKKAFTRLRPKKEKKK